MIEQLFGSKTRVKLLHLFFNNPNRSFYVREITRKIDEQINSVRRELANLLKIGIIKSDSSDASNKKLYYEVNQSYEHYEAMRSIFAGTEIHVGKPQGDDLVTKSQDLGAVELVLLTGSFTRDMTAGLDVLVVGDVNKTKLGKYIKELEEEEGRELAYAVMTKEDFEYRRDINDRFITDILSAKSTVVVDRAGMLAVA